MASFLDEWNNDSEYVEVKTSGSTGEPKRMMVEKRRMLNSARITCDFLGLKPGDTALLCMSTDYIAGKMMIVRSIERGLKLISVPPSGHPLNNVQCSMFRSASPLGSSKNVQYSIVLDHQPYNLDRAEAAGVDFQLSGHTHRGQVWPISWITDRIYECSWGSHQRGSTQFYVSSGIGIWGGKFRIGTQSEYVVATLK